MQNAQFPGAYVKTLALPFLAAIVSAFGQILLKYSVDKHGPIEFSVGGLARLFANPLILSTILVYAMTFVLWIYVLSKLRLSIAYPVLAVTYVLVPLMSVYFFGDRLNGFQIAGISIIVFGLIVLGQGV